MISAAEVDKATNWVRAAGLAPAQLDCITAIMLKILDGKCKMEARQQSLLAVIYTATRRTRGELFNESHHAVIQAAMLRHPLISSMSIHKLRLYAEAEIPKPVMKAFKHFLRQSLFASDNQISSRAAS